MPQAESPAENPAFFFEELMGLMSAMSSLSARNDMLPGRTLPMILSGLLSNPRVDPFNLNQIEINAITGNAINIHNTLMLALKPPIDGNAQVVSEAGHA